MNESLTLGRVTHAKPLCKRRTRIDRTTTSEIKSYPLCRTRLVSRASRNNNACGITGVQRRSNGLIPL